MANTVGINDKTMELLKLVSQKTGQSQAETVLQALILLGSEAGLIKAKEEKVQVIKRTFSYEDVAEDAGANVNRH